MLGWSSSPVICATISAPIAWWISWSEQLQGLLLLFQSQIGPFQLVFELIVKQASFFKLLLQPLESQICVGCDVQVSLVESHDVFDYYFLFLNLSLDSMLHLPDASSFFLDACHHVTELILQHWRHSNSWLRMVRLLQVDEFLSQCILVSLCLVDVLYFEWELLYQKFDRIRERYDLQDQLDGLL